MRWFRCRQHQSDPVSVRAQALADAWYAVHASRFDGGKPDYSGPDSFYGGCKNAEGLIEGLPGYDPNVEPAAVSAYKQRQNCAGTWLRSDRIGETAPTGVGSTSRDLTPTNGVSEGEG